MPDTRTADRPSEPTTPTDPTGRSGRRTPETTRRPSGSAARSCATACPDVVDTDEGLAGGVRRAGRGDRSGRDRRRARLRLPLLRPRLPDPAAPRGRRHAGSSTRSRSTTLGPAAGGPRRHRVDPARRDAGPAVPARGRASTPTASSTPSSPAACSATPASGWPPWSRRCSASGCARSTPPPTGRPVRCPQPWLEYAALDVEVLARAARAHGHGARARPARPSGRARSSTTCWASSRPSGSTRGGVRPGCTGCAGAAPSAPPGPCGRPATRIAAERDVTPGRIIPDSAIVAAATAHADRPARADAHAGLPRPRRRAATPAAWVEALRRGPRDGRGRPAHPRPARRRPPAPAHLGRARRRSPTGASRPPARPMLNLAEEHHLPVENLLTPDYLRRLMWAPPATREPAELAEAVRAQLASYGARPWQAGLVTGALVGADARRRARTSRVAADSDGDSVGLLRRLRATRSPASYSGSRIVLGGLVDLPRWPPRGRASPGGVMSCVEQRRDRLARAPGRWSRAAGRPCRGCSG